ncbi:two-component sensor histidine kinase AdeS [Acinetobacter lactucae]|uniref:histidine kinase n=1 Tax=Acinetobacter lactucae TaxID=1785128 RepID=A0AB35K1T5_9GAMM|nr:two-component sensor histidine kinase AdeS [Acinetobacter lactucae]MDD9317258.1 two-component sensor histidine kinase AdeS [Acinetobacter lactucae]MDD9321388.1 two-component sensor histidine kinase AdeS [Acinetobacter lactucae]RSO33020.1 two-component sensor histidine kinase AdeS [Acinetobacter lactucae]
MNNKFGINKQLFIAFSMVNLSITFLAIFVGYCVYKYAIGNGWISLSSLQGDFIDFHIVDWIWLFVVGLSGSIISLIIGMQLAKRFIVPINSLSNAANKISEGDLSARANDQQIHSSEISRLILNFNGMAQKLEDSVHNAQVWNAAIAHELRTPITILQGRLQGIVDGVFIAEPNLMRSLLNQVEGLSYLVEDLRTISLFENNQLKLNIESIDFLKCVEKIVQMFEEKLIQAKITIDSDISHDSVWCDSRRIEQVLIALIDNAVRYSNSGVLKIKSSVERDQWTLEILDEGPGIPLEYQKELFNPFYRVEQSRNKALGGTGLGLAVVQAIVLAHSGTIRYQNRNNRSVFTITLPMFNKSNT